MTTLLQKDLVSLSLCSFLLESLAKHKAAVSASRPRSDLCSGWVGGAGMTTTTTAGCLTQTAPMNATRPETLLICDHGGTVSGPLGFICAKRKHRIRTPRKVASKQSKDIHLEADNPQTPVSPISPVDVSSRVFPTRLVSLIA